MNIQDKAVLAIELNKYINLKENQDKCSGFIDGFKAAVKHLRK
jgi:hypothetical protein